MRKPLGLPVLDASPAPDRPPSGADAGSADGRRFERAFLDAPIGMALVDTESSLLAVNSALCAFLGRGEQELLALGVEALTHPDELDGAHARVEAALAGGESTYQTESRYLRPDGSVVWAHLSVSLVRGDGTDGDYFITQVVDITERKHAEAELCRYTAELEGLTAVDALTGLGNRRALTEALDRELHRCQRHGGRFCLVALALEGGEVLQRSHGRASYDEVLREVAGVLTEQTRLSDLVTRSGDHEFSLLLPETGRKGADRFLERLDEALAELEETPTFSTGVADFPAAGTTRELLIIRAEMDLYAHRRSATLAPGIEHGVARVLELSRSLLGLPLEYLTAEAATESERTVTAGPDEPEEVPVCLPDGRRHGTLRTTGDDPRRPEPADGLLTFLAALIGERVEQDRQEHDTRRVEAEISGMHALVAALTARDHYTADHSERVVELAGGVAWSLGLGEEARLSVEHVALLHDIGKVGIPDALLQKQGPLNAQEWQLMCQHPAVGARMLEASSSLAHLAPAVRAEHERWDGTGYPDGLQGTAIPLASRIVLACDAYQAMTSDRPYRHALGEGQARAQLLEGAGGQFDPVVVDALVAILDGDLTSRGGLLEVDAAPGAVLLGFHREPESLWSPLGSPGRGRITGEVRASCDRCGVHVTATISVNGINGSCENCGSYELTLAGG